jgi:quinoprotein glucose dehydrogenase
MPTDECTRRIRDIFRAAGLTWSVLAMAGTALSQEPYTAWRDYKGSADSSNYSALRQINRSNVNKLGIAWSYDTNDQIEYPFAPLVVDRTLFAVARNGSLVAVDATTGKELWVHDFRDTPLAVPARGGRGGGAGISGYRGLNYWKSRNASDERIFVRERGYLQAIDARTGKLVQSFGDNGRVDLRTGIDRNDGPVTSRSPGRVFENLIILGSATGTGYGRPPGDIRAFDTVTGKLAWVFHTVPRPGEFGYETNPKDGWQHIGGANNWGEMSVDVKRGIVFIPTGSPTYDFYGGDRLGNNLFGDCLLALDARTGKRIWHFQDVHHDLWDYDLNSAPQLITVQHDGKPVDVVAQAGKTGFLYVFERATGKPLWPIEERPVPKSDVPGEVTSPTQPFPSNPPPFAVQKFTVDDISPYMMSPDYRTKLRQFMLKARNEGIFTPPSADKFTVQMPGHSGGAGVFASSAEPARGIVFIQSFNEPAFLKLEPTEAAAAGNVWYGPLFPPADGRGFESVSMAADDLPWGSARPGWPVTLGVRAPARNPSPGSPDTPGQHYYTAYGWAPGTIKPPWSTITAYDLNAGTIKWEIPYGEALGIPPAGNNFGILRIHGVKAGLAVTAGGLLFSATVEHKIRAYDSDTGEIVWTAPLPGGAEGSPAIYELDGREYIVVGMRGSYVAFALPENSLKH